MDQQNDTFEYEWWKVFAGYLLLFIVSVTLIGTLYFFIQVTDDQYALFRLIGLGFLGGMGLLFSIGGIWTIRSVPRLIIFKQSSVNIVLPFKQEKVFQYEDIKRIVVLRSITKRSQLFTTSWSPFRVRIYFLNHAFKVMFNPDRLINFPVLLETLKQKGLGSVIEQK